MICVPSKNERLPGFLIGQVMKRFIWRYMWLIVSVVWGFVSLPDSAVARPPGLPPDHGARLEQLVEALGLDEATLAKVQQIIDASKAEHQELRQRLRKAGRQMHALLEQENPDEAAVMAQADAIGALKIEAQKHRLRTMLKVRAFLTPEQRAKLLEMLRARRSCKLPEKLPSQAEP
jgi:Spy/CpxP family protein refolding chaperone